MNDARAIAGEYADLKTVKTRSVVQIVIECPIEEGANIVKVFGFPLPGQPIRLAVARLKSTPTIESEVVPSTPQPDTKRAGEKKEWSEYSPAQQAGMRCHAESFWTFLRESGDASCYSEEKAAEYVRFICGVKSRAELNTNGKAASKWRDLDRQFQAWLADPVMVA